MSEKKKKSRKQFRKEIRQPDEFVTQSNRLIEWASANPRMLQAGIGVFLVVLVVIGVVGYRNDARQNEATLQFYAASELFKRDQFEHAYDAFHALAETLSGTSYGDLASAYAGRAALELGRDDDAIRAYRKFLATGAGGTALEQLARLNLAHALKATHDTTAARAELETAAALDGPAGPAVQFALGESFEASGDTEEALASFQNYLAEEPQGIVAAQARARIIALGGTPPRAPGPDLGNLQAQM